MAYKLLLSRDEIDEKGRRERFIRAKLEKCGRLDEKNYSDQTIPFVLNKNPWTRVIISATKLLVTIELYAGQTVYRGIINFHLGILHSV